MADRAFQYDGREAAAALVSVLGDSAWIAVDLAHGFLALESGETLDSATHTSCRNKGLSLKRCRELLQRATQEGFIRILEERSDTGSSVNPITKLFPATVTEQRSLEELDALSEERPSMQYTDDRESGHTLSDFTLSEGDDVLPINIKNAGTRFEQAQQLVGLDPDDCIPIPAYKAYAAVESMPNLLYVISVDYTLVETLDALLPRLFSREEAVVWDLLTRFKGTRIRRAEDSFILRMVATHWTRIKAAVAGTPFYVASARKAIKVLQDKPMRTPGIGLRAWGNRASAEVNVHLSLSEDTKLWPDVRARLKTEGLSGIIQSVNRRVQAWVYDPEL